MLAFYPPRRQLFCSLGLQFYRGLKLLGKDAEMVRYPREPHWFHEPAHQEDVQRRVLAFFDAQL